MSTFAIRHVPFIVWLDTGALTHTGALIIAVAAGSLALAGGAALALRERPAGSAG